MRRTSPDQDDSLLLQREAFENSLGNAGDNKHDGTPKPGKIDDIFLFEHGMVDALAYGFWLCK